MQHVLIRSTATGSWVLTMTLMIVATSDHELVLCAWSILLGIGATMPTAWLIVDHLVRSERDRTERLVSAVLRHAIGGGGDGGDGDDRGDASQRLRGL